MLSIKRQNLPNLKLGETEMKNLRNILSAGILLAAITGTTFATTGITILSRNAQADTKTSYFAKVGILIRSVAGITILSRTGILIQD